MVKHELNHKEKSLLAVLGILLTFYAYFLLIHQPVTQELDSLNQQIEDAELRVTTLQTQQARLKQMKEELKTSTAVPIPDYDNLQSLIVFLHAIMPTSAEYDIHYEDPVPVAEGSDILARKLSISFVSGSYETARHMLKQLENSPFRCQVDHLNLMPVRDKSPITSGAVKVSLVATFFEYRENTTPVAAEEVTAEAAQ